MVDEEFHERVAEWLRSEGYPLEMQVAAAFRKSGFQTIQSEFYDDPDTGKPREVDVHASMQREIAGTLVRVSFSVECKVSRDKPWVLFSTGDALLADPATVAQRAATPLGQRFLYGLAWQKAIQRLPLFALPARPSYGLAQAFGGADRAYEAVMSAAKAAAVSVREDANWHRLCEIVFPLVVLDGRLFEAFLAEDGLARTLETSSGTLVWRQQIVGMPHTIVAIITLAYLDSFLGQAVETADALLKAADRLPAILSRADKKSRRMAPKARRRPRLAEDQERPRRSIDTAHPGSTAAASPDDGRRAIADSVRES